MGNILSGVEAIGSGEMTIQYYAMLIIGIIIIVTALGITIYNWAEPDEDEISWFWVVVGGILGPLLIIMAIYYNKLSGNPAIEAIVGAETLKKIF